MLLSASRRRHDSASMLCRNDSSSSMSCHNSNTHIKPRRDVNHHVATVQKCNGNTNYMSRWASGKMWWRPDEVADKTASTILKPKDKIIILSFTNGNTIFTHVAHIKPELKYHGSFYYMYTYDMYRTANLKMKSFSVCTATLPRRYAGRIQIIEIITTNRTLKFK